MMERGNLVLSISESCRLDKLSYCIILASFSFANPSSSPRRRALRRQRVVGLHGAAHFLPQRTVARAHLCPGRSSLQLGDRLCCDTSTRFDAKTANGSGPCIRDTSEKSAVRKITKRLNNGSIFCARLLTSRGHNSRAAPSHKTSRIRARDFFYGGLLAEYHISRRVFFY
jgi:hypothetical protein